MFRGSELDRNCPDCLYLHYHGYFSQNFNDHQSKAIQTAFKGLMYGVLLLTLVLPAYAEQIPAVDLEVIATIESSNNPNAIGDGGKAIGLYQLHEGVILDWNKVHKQNLEWHICALDASCSKDMASWYMVIRIPQMLRSYGLPVTRDNVLTAWNMGAWSVKQGKIAKNYIAKYEEVTHVS
jgi:hypothetical protein